MTYREEQKAKYSTDNFEQDRRAINIDASYKPIVIKSVWPWAFVNCLME